MLAVVLGAPLLPGQPRRELLKPVAIEQRQRLAQCVAGWAGEPATMCESGAAQKCSKVAVSRCCLCWVATLTFDVNHNMDLQ